MADETAAEKAAREAKEQADAQAAQGDKPKAKAEASPEQKQATELRARADAAHRDPATGEATRAALEAAAIRAELAINPRDEFREHAPYYIVDGEKRGPNGRPLGKDGKEVPGPLTEWMPVT